MISQSSTTQLNSNYTTRLNRTTLKMSCDSICSENGLEFVENEGVRFTLPNQISICITSVCCLDFGLCKQQLPFSLILP